MDLHAVAVLEEKKELLKNYFEREIKWYRYSESWFWCGTLQDLFDGTQNGTKVFPNGKPIELLRYGLYPTDIVVLLMSEILRVINYSHSDGFPIWNLDPCGVSVFIEDRLSDDFSYFCVHARLTDDFFDKGIEGLHREAPEEHGGKYAGDYALARLLFFCLTGGGEIPDLKTCPGSIAVEHRPDLTLVEHIPQANELILTLLHLGADERTDAPAYCSTSVNDDDPLFWTDALKFNFICEASRRIVRGDGSQLESFVDIAAAAFRDSSLDSNVDGDRGKVNSLLKELELDLGRNYYKIEPTRGFQFKEFDGLAKEYGDRYPRLFYELYKLFSEHYSSITEDIRDLVLWDP